MSKYANINVITGALKLYLRLLPIPLITFLVHPLLIDAMRKYYSKRKDFNYLSILFSEHKNLDLRISSIIHALKSLPKPHYETLKYMINHLQRYFFLNFMLVYNDLRCSKMVS